MIDLNLTAIALNVFSSLASTPTSNAPNFFDYPSPLLALPILPQVNSSALINASIKVAKPLLYPTFPLIPPLTNDGQCYSPSTMKSIHTTNRNYLSLETSSLTFVYYSSHPRFPPPRPPPKKKTLASKIRSTVWKWKRNVKQMVNRAMECAQSVNQKVKQNVSRAMETLAKYSRFSPLFTFLLGIIQHGAVRQLIVGLERAIRCTGRLLRDVALTTSRKITSGARAIITIMIGFSVFVLNVFRMITSDARAFVRNFINYSIMLLLNTRNLLRRLINLSSRVSSQQVSSLPVASSSNDCSNPSPPSLVASTAVLVSSSSYSSPANPSSSTIGDASSLAASSLTVPSAASPSSIASSPSALISSSANSSGDQDVQEGSSSGGNLGASPEVVSVLLFE